MRITKQQLEYYVSLLNGLSDNDTQVALDIAYGGYKLVSNDHRTEYTPYRMTCRECYYVVLGMYNREIAKLRYANTKE